MTAREHHRRRLADPDRHGRRHHRAADPAPLGRDKGLASTVAIARTAKEECIGTRINEAYIEDLRQRLHVVEADYSAYVPEARAVADTLHNGIAEAPSRQAWCDAVLRMYGPTGYVIRGLLLRP